MLNLREKRLLMSSVYNFEIYFAKPLELDRDKNTEILKRIPWNSRHRTILLISKFLPKPKSPQHFSVLALKRHSPFQQPPNMWSQYSPAASGRDFLTAHRPIRLLRCLANGKIFFEWAVRSPYFSLCPAPTPLLDIFCLRPSSRAFISPPSCFTGFDELKRKNRDCS